MSHSRAGRVFSVVRFKADMLISEVLRTDPATAGVFERFDLGCAGCLAAGMESVGDVANSHDVSTSELLDALNALPSNDAEEA